MINDRRFVDFVFKGLIGLPESDIKKLYKLIDAKNKMPEDKFSSEVRKITDDETKAAIFEKFTSLKNISDIKNFVSNFFDTTSASDLHHYKSEIPISITTHVTPLYKLFEKLDHLGLSEFVKFDPSIVRGLDYYTGTVFEIYDKHPDNRRAIAGGGSYANLLQIFDESPLEGVGVGLGEVPLVEFLKTHDLLPDFTKSDIDYLVAYLVDSAEELAQQFAMKLRKAGHKVELIPFEMKPKKVFTYADKKNVKYICFIGEDELKNNCAKIKNVADKTEQVIDLNDVR
jgi:histidyl-tRNA synthetase